MTERLPTSRYDIERLNRLVNEIANLSFEMGATAFLG